MFESQKELNGRITALETRNAELEDALTEAKEQAAASAQQLTEAVAAKESAQAELLGDQAKLITSEAAVATLTSENAELEKALEDDAPRVAASAAKQLAELGHEAVEVPGSEVSTKSASKIREEFDAMPPGPERSAFYRANRLAISK